MATQKQTKSKFMREIDKSIRRMNAVIQRVKKMDHADRYYLLSRLKAKECCDVHAEQRKAEAR